MELNGWHSPRNPKHKYTPMFCDKQTSEFLIIYAYWTGCQIFSYSNKHIWYVQLCYKEKTLSTICIPPFPLFYIFKTIPWSIPLKYTFCYFAKNLYIIEGHPYHAYTLLPNFILPAFQYTFSQLCAVHEHHQGHFYLKPQWKPMVKHISWPVLIFLFCQFLKYIP